MSNNLGIRVKITLKWPGFGVEKTELRNVTEIHYNYSKLDKQRTAFESNIHGTGITYDNAQIVEFETRPEIEKADHF